MTITLNEITSCASLHVGDEHLKRMYAISLLSLCIKNIEEPLHIHIYGDPESGKTDLQTRYLAIVPDQNKDVASDFSPRVLMYANLVPGTVISINDKIFNDAICTLLNQVCDSTAWKYGRTIAVTIGKDRVNLVFPPRTLFWMNSNKSISQYNVREVDPIAVESRYLVFEKKYTIEDKKHIFTHKPEAVFIDPTAVQHKLSEMLNTPVQIDCSPEMRTMIWDLSCQMGVSSMRSIGRSLTICQVFALLDNRTFVNTEDIHKMIALIKEQIYLRISSIDTKDAKIISMIKADIPTRQVFTTLSQTDRLKYTASNISDRIKITDIDRILTDMAQSKEIGCEHIAHVTRTLQRQSLPCYYKEV